MLQPIDKREAPSEDIDTSVTLPSNLVFQTNEAGSFDSDIA
jgi:hypothetical protein